MKYVITRDYQVNGWREINLVSDIITPEEALKDLKETGDEIKFIIEQAWDIKNIKDVIDMPLFKILKTTSKKFINLTSEDTVYAVGPYSDVVVRMKLWEANS